MCPVRQRIPATTDERPRWFRAAVDRLGEGALHPLTLRFRDPDLEAACRAEFFRRNVGVVRIAYVLGLVLWTGWGLAVRGYLGDDRGFDLTIRYGVVVPLLLVGIALTYAPGHRRRWEYEAVAVIVASQVAWITYAAGVESMPVDWGYVGVLLITTFSFTLVRLRARLVGIVSSVSVAYYLVVAGVTGEPAGRRLVIAAIYLLSFSTLGLIASYVLERSSRLLFLRELQLDRERRRSDSLLLNILPRPIAERLKGQEDTGQRERLAETLPDVTVLFADAVGFTRQTASADAGAVVDALDGFFRRCDVLADRSGLEKIKTVGDAYMAVAGAPEPMREHEAAAAEMALSIVEELREARWPSGDRIDVRIGLAVGPVVAGVIGRKKFAYDLWGATVNLASRLEAHARPGGILVSEELANRLGERYAFGPPKSIDIKGLGTTPARELLSRRAAG
jgi:class 3 adenylate cyclase